MDDAQEQDHYEERLKEVFNSFDASGSGSLNPEELSDLCQSLHLDDATPALLHTLLQKQDNLTARVRLLLPLAKDSVINFKICGESMVRHCLSCVCQMLCYVV